MPVSMKIIIIEPYDLNPHCDQRSLTPSPGPIVIASLLHQAGHDVEVLSEYVAKFNVELIDDADLIGISITTYNARRGFELAQQARQPIVFGGFHASLMPEECLEYGDFVIRGDGYSIVDLADYLSGRTNVNISHIPNLVFKRKGRAVFNAIESRSINVVPNYNLVRDYYKFNFKQLVRIPLLVNGSRGCHHDCAFCSIKAVYPDFKKKEVQVIIDDIRSQINNRTWLAWFFPKIIWITDDNFSSDKKWAKEVLKAIAELKTGYCFTVQARVDIAQDDELLNLMVEANINRVYLGIESLDQTTLDSFNKNTSRQGIKIAVKKLKNHGIDVHGLFVFGDDEFKKGDGQRVAEFVKKYGLSGLLIQPITPFPGTDLFKKFEEENRILHRNWEYYNGKVVITPKNMTPAELQKEIYDCYSKVFSVWRIIRFFFIGNKGWKLEFIGEAIFRHLEKLKANNYQRENLVHFSDN